MEEKIILIAKMYTGDYIEENIGHEIINFFKPDKKDFYYGYIIHDGKIHKEEKEVSKIDTILLVSDIKDRKVKILAKIEKPIFISNKEDNIEKQVKYIEKNDIRYGNVLLNDIMNESGKDEYGIYITYKANKIEELEDDTYILLKDSKQEENRNNIKTGWNIGHDYGYMYNTKNKEDYNKLTEIIKNYNWKEIEEKIIDETILSNYSNLEDNKESFMDLVKKEYDENVISNMLFYYFDKKKMFKDFAKNILNVNVSDNVEITREKSTSSNSKRGRIDLWVEDKERKTCIVIENKIKSAINGRYYENDKETNKEIVKSQLYKYKKWVDEYKENKKYKYEGYLKKYFIFVPNYKKEELIKDIRENNLMPKDENGQDIYSIITYQEIFNYFNQEKLKNEMKNDKYYEDFVRALSKHIYTSDKEMERKFVSAIKKAKRR